MLRVFLSHSPDPVYVRPAGASISTTYTAQIHIRCDERTRIAGLKASWQVTLRRPIGRSIQVMGEWASPQVLETILTDVCKGTTWIDPGETT